MIYKFLFLLFISNLFAENFADDNQNGVWDKAEPFTDLRNGKYDSGEKFVDLYSNSKWDAQLWYIDKNSNNKWDDGEPFEDLNKDGKKSFSEPYTDKNNNKLYDPPEQINNFKFNYSAVLFSEPFTDQSNGNYDLGESFQDNNGDGIWTPAEEFEDTNGDGVWTPAEEFEDLNRNKIWDAINPESEKPDDEKEIPEEVLEEKEYKAPIVDIPDEPVEEMKIPVEFIDANNNGHFDTAEHFAGKHMAILDFDSEEGISESEARILTQTLTNKMIELSDYVIIERVNIDKILKEQEFQHSGCTNSQCAVQIGQILNVDLIIIGAAGKIGSTYTLQTRIINVETGKGLKSAKVIQKGAIDELLITGIESIAYQLLEVPKEPGINNNEKEVPENNFSNDLTQLSEYKIIDTLISSADEKDPLSFISSYKINLNSATLEELQILELTDDQIESILDYRSRLGYIHNIYDLLNLTNITINDIHAIRNAVTVDIPQASTFEKDMARASYKMGRWISNEGSTEGLSEVWLDRFIEPQNINDMNYDDLMALPNLSPVDVTAVLKQKNRGYINGTWELKNSPGISYWGYKNLVDFIRFTDKPVEESGFHVRINSLVRTVPITSNPDDEGNITAFEDTSMPEQFHKVSIILDKNMKGGVSYHRYMGQPDSIYTLKGFIQDEKWKISENVQIGRIILGNYTASFGQGVIFETNDNFSPRRTGFGFSKRAEGIHGDLTRSSQYVMQGSAVQISMPKLRGVMFASYHPRDAIINADSSFTSLIVMQPRLPFGAYGQFAINSDGDTTYTKIYHSLIGSVNEITWGGNLRLTPAIGTNLGFTFFESLYDRSHIPQVINTITGGDDDLDPEFSPDDYDDYSGDAFIYQYITNSGDSEIAAMDSSEADSPIWSDAKSFFRVRGFDFSTVIANLAIQGEYGEMLKDNNLLKFGRSPSAMVLSAYAQFENFNILTLYRNYDLKYDNPYQRSYSNYQRYKTSIFEDDYWLEDPVYSYLYSANPQPQAEEGFFISSRYQFHRSMVGYLNWDTWNRKADNAKYYRTVATVEWRPAFNFRIKVRQKWQARGAFDLQHPSPFYSRETRITSRLRMSRYNQFEILYSNGYTTFSPRPRLTDNALGGDMMVGNIGSPDETIGVSISHNADDSFSIKGGMLYIQGFLWYFEDTDFRIFSSENGMVHSWVAVDLKPSPLFRVMFKVSHSTEGASTRVVDGQTPQGNWIRNPQVTSEDLDYRIQLSYAL